MRKFLAVLLKPLDQQADRDGLLIDPAGVEFDPEETYPIFPEFDYSAVIGSGKVSRAGDGSLVVSGELTLDPSYEEDSLPYTLAIGVRYDSERNGLPYAAHSALMGIGLTRKHVDPTQPRLTIIP